MFVRNIRLDRFGNHSHIHLDLSAGLHAVLGSPGSGKRSLLRFIRSMFFGFDAATRAEFLPSDSRGFGGSMTLIGQDGRQTISRYDDGSREGRLTIQHQDGRVIGRNHLEGLLAGLSQSQYDRLCAVDFDHQLNIDALVQTLNELKIADRSRTSDRERVLHEAIEEDCRVLEALPETGESLAELRLARDRLRQQTTPWGQYRGGSDRHARHHVEQRIRDCTSALRASQDALESVNDELDRLGGPQPPASHGNPSNRLDELDAQIEQIQRTLRLSVSSGRVVAPRPAAGDGGAEVRALLFDLEEKLRRLKALGEPAGAAPATDSLLGFRAQVAECVPEMLDAVYRIGRGITSRETELLCEGRERHAAQWQRAGDELNRVLQNLFAERRRLLRAEPCADRPASLAAVRDESYSRQYALPDLPPANPRVGVLVARRTQLLDEIQQREHELYRWTAQRDAMDRHAQVDERDRLDGRCHELRELERQIDIAEQRERLQAAIAHRRETLRANASAPGGTEALALASAFLKRVTSDDWSQVDVDAAGRVSIRSHDGQVWWWHQLDEAGQAPVYLSLVLATVLVLARRGVVVPVVLRNVFTHFQARNIHESVEVFRECAAEGIQLIVLTPYEHVACEFRLQNVPVQQLPAPSTPVAAPASAPSGEAIKDRWEPAPPRPLHPTTREPHARPERRTRLSREDAIEAAPLMDSGKAGTPVASIACAPDAHSSASRLHACSARYTQLREMGVTTVGQLLDADAEILFHRLCDEGVTAEMLHDWQAEAHLLCEVPGLRPYDARVLVACGVTDPRQLQQLQPSRLQELVERFAATSRGQAVLLSGKEFELSRLTDWMKRFNDDRAISPQTPAKVAAESRVEAAVEAAAREPAEEAPRGPAHAPAGDEASHAVLPISGHDELEFHLDLDDDVEAAPSIGAKTAERLHDAGVVTVADLLAADPESLAERIQHRRIHARTIAQWQSQASLVCRVPGLRGHDAQILVALEIDGPASLAQCAPDDLWQKVEPFVQSQAGKRVIRNGREPDLREVTDWIRRATLARPLKAA